MSRVRSISFCAALLAAFLCASSSAATEPPWLEIHSTHYTLITDAGEARGRDVALRFEQMRAVFGNVLSRDRLHQSIPLTILAFQNDKLYYQVAPLRNGQAIDVPGFFLPGDDQDFIVLNLSESDAWRAVSRDFAMMLLNYNYPPTQEWFDNGLAEYFSSLRVDGRQVEIGGDPELRITAGSGDQSKVSYTSASEVLNTQPWMRLPELVSIKSDPAGKQDSQPAIFYAESWILMHYLLHEKKLEETGTYFGLVQNQHLSPEEAIQKAYGVSAEKLEQSVQEYFHSQATLFRRDKTATATATAPAPAAAATPGPIERYPVPVGIDDSAITWKPIPAADARAMYAGVQVRVPERYDIGVKTLQDLATTPTEADKKAEAKQQVRRMGEDPDQLPSAAIGNALAHRMLAWDHIQHGDYEESFVEIGDAAALNRTDLWQRYYLSVAKCRMSQAKHTDILGLANMLLDLKAVLEWNPEMADAYDLLAVGRNAGGTTSAAMQAAHAAIGLSPRNQLYNYHLAEIYVASKKWDAANALLERLKASSNPQIAAQAVELASKSGVERKYGIPVNTSSTTQPKLEAQKTPFDILEEDAAKREAAEHAQPKTGDKRTAQFVKGRLLAVDCSKTPSAILTVSAQQGILKLRSADYRSLLLIGSDNFSCDWRDVEVTVNYKPMGGADGDLISLEMH
jgi:hypothetical protein